MSGLRGKQKTKAALNLDQETKIESLERLTPLGQTPATMLMAE